MTTTANVVANGLPTFLIIGAMKAGTTSLHGYLSKHPDVSMSTVKETNFFLDETRTPRRFDWYARQFDPARPVRGETSPNYAKRQIWSGVPDRIAATVPDVRLVFIARDPIRRIMSQYVHNVAHGRERRTFAHAIRKDRNYVATSRYAYQLEPYIERFGRDRILVLDSVALRDETTTTVRTVLDFVGASPGRRLPGLGGQLHTGAEKGHRSRLERWFGRRRVLRRLEPVLPVYLTERAPVSRPEQTAADIDYLGAELTDDVQAFRKLARHDFADWTL